MIEEYPPRAHEPLLGDRLNAEQTARLLGIRPATLRQWRSLHRGPSYFKLGRAVWYLRTDVVAYVRAARVQCEQPKST